MSRRIPASFVQLSGNRVFLTNRAAPMMDAGTSWRSVLHKLPGTFSAKGVLWIEGVRLDKNYRLRTRNLKSFPATHVSTSEHVVDSDQVIPGLLKASAIHLVCASGRL